MRGNRAGHGQGHNSMKLGGVVGHCWRWSFSGALRGLGSCMFMLDTVDMIADQSAEMV